MTHENSQALEVVVQGPNVSTIFGSTHPLGFLFENGVNLEHAKQDHNELVRTLKENHINVTSFEDILRKLPREELLQQVMQRLQYKAEPPLTLESFTPEEREKFFSDDYKLKAISSMDTEMLITLILCPCEVLLRKSDKNTHVEASLVMHPLCNLLFTRDQIIVTANGIVVSNMDPPQRAQEPVLAKFLYEKSGRKILGALEGPCKLEGGDFFPLGRELCMIGVGLRTTDDAIQHMLNHDWFGTRRVAVVRDLYDHSQDRMHLDTYFNIANDEYVVLLESVITNPARKREVTEYIRHPNGKYTTNLTMEFSEYLERIGFHIIRVSETIQQNYGINFLNLGAGRIVLLNRDMEKLLRDTLGDRVKITFVQFRDVNAMYGGIHCATQAFRKEDEEHPVRSVDLDLLRPKHASLEVPSQTTSHVLMIAPTSFEFNLETAQDNAFMHQLDDVGQIRFKLLAQYAQMVEALRSHGVRVSVFNHELHHQTPDACFPNNWFSTHYEQGHNKCILYPMKAPSRRRERREDIIAYLKNLGYHVEDFLLHLEKETEPSFLEGTGSLVLNRQNKTAYCVISERSHEKAAKEWAKHTGYNLVLFHSTDSNNKPVYHTNVVISVGTSVAIFCDESVLDEHERKLVMDSLQKSGKKVVKISLKQMDQFCANVLELSTQSSDNRNIMMMSKTAFDGFTADQKKVIEESCTIVHADISLLETLGGGSARCCIAELF